MNSEELLEFIGNMRNVESLTDEFLVSSVLDNGHFFLLEKISKQKLEIFAMALLNSKLIYKDSFFQYIVNTVSFKVALKNEEDSNGLFYHIKNNPDNFMCIDLSQNLSKALIKNVVKAVNFNNDKNKDKCKQYWIKKILKEIPNHFWEQNIDIFDRFFITNKYNLSYKMVRSLSEELLLYYIAVNPRLIKNFLEDKGVNDVNIEKTIIYSAARDYVRKIEDLSYDEQKNKYEKIINNLDNLNNYINSYFHISNEPNVLLNYKKLMEKHLRYILKTCEDNNFISSYFQLSNDKLNYNLLAVLKDINLSIDEKNEVIENLVVVLKNKENKKPNALLHILGLDEEIKNKNCLNELFLNRINLNINDLDTITENQLSELMISLHEKRLMEKSILPSNKISKKVKF